MYNFSNSNSFSHSSLTDAFTNTVLSKITSGKKYTRYCYAQLQQDIARMGAVYAVKKMLHKEMTGYPYDYTRLYLDGKTNLMVESAVIDPAYQSLFTSEEIQFCMEFFLPDAA